MVLWRIILRPPVPQAADVAVRMLQHTNFDVRQDQGLLFVCQYCTQIGIIEEAGVSVGDGRAADRLDEIQAHLFWQQALLVKRRQQARIRVVLHRGGDGNRRMMGHNARSSARKSASGAPVGNQWRRILPMNSCARAVCGRSNKSAGAPSSTTNPSAISTILVDNSRTNDISC